MVDVKDKLKLKGFKGFDNSLSCRGFQYEIGKTFVHKGEVICCASGFHFCENPLDVFEYYKPYDSRYCIVYGYGERNKDGFDSKVSVEKIDISEEIGVEDIIKGGIEYIIDKANTNKKTCEGESKIGTNLSDFVSILNKSDKSISASTGNYSVSYATGIDSISSNTGDKAASISYNIGGLSSNAGEQSIAFTSGSYSISSNTGGKSASCSYGERSISVNTGYYSVSYTEEGESISANIGRMSVSKSKGDYSISVSIGENSKSCSDGYSSVSINSGKYSSSEVNSKDSIAIATGFNSRAKGVLGSWIVIAEIDAFGSSKIKDVKTFKVDGINIKENTFYTLKDGEAVEVNNL